MLNNVRNYVKHCMVPMCTNSTINSPNKRFLTAPINRDKFQQWINAVNSNPNVQFEPTKNSSRFCCEDHFDLEKDAENWIRIKLMGATTIRLKNGVIPHIFTCQTSDCKQKNVEENKKTNNCKSDSNVNMENKYASQVESVKKSIENNLITSDKTFQPTNGNNIPLKKNLEPEKMNSNGKRVPCIPAKSNKKQKLMPETKETNNIMAKDIVFYDDPKESETSIPGKISSVYIKSNPSAIVSLVLDPSKKVNTIPKFVPNLVLKTPEKVYTRKKSQITNEAKKEILSKEKIPELSNVCTPILKKQNTNETKSALTKQKTILPGKVMVKIKSIINTKEIKSSLTELNTVLPKKVYVCVNKSAINRQNIKEIKSTLLAKKVNLPQVHKQNTNESKSSLTEQKKDPPTNVYRPVINKQNTNETKSGLTEKKTIYLSSHKLAGNKQETNKIDTEIQPIIIKKVYSLKSAVSSSKQNMNETKSKKVKNKQITIETNSAIAEQKLILPKKVYTPIHYSQLNKKNTNETKSTLVEQKTILAPNNEEQKVKILYTPVQNTKETKLTQTEEITKLSPTPDLKIKEENINDSKQNLKSCVKQNTNDSKQKLNPMLKPNVNQKNVRDYVTNIDETFEEECKTFKEYLLKNYGGFIRNSKKIKKIDSERISTGAFEFIDVTNTHETFEEECKTFKEHLLTNYRGFISNSKKIKKFDSEEISTGAFEFIDVNKIPNE